MERGGFSPVTGKVGWIPSAHAVWVLCLCLCASVLPTPTLPGHTDVPDWGVVLGSPGLSHPEERRFIE